MLMTLRSAILLVLVTAALTAAAGAQDGQTITIDFLAVDANGAPVEHLSPPDLNIRINGREVAVRSIDLITVGGSTDRSETTAPVSAGTLPAPFGETKPLTASRARNILLLLDEGTLFGLEQIVRDSVAKLIASLHPDDRLGLATTRPGGVTVNPTRNHSEVKAALDGIVLGRGNAALCVGAMLGQVQGIAESLPMGKASTLAVISRGAGTAPVPTAPAISGAGNCTFRREDLSAVEQAVEATQINYHVFHVGGSGLSRNLDDFAGATGGDTGILSWTDATGIERAVRRTSRFYRAVVDAPAARSGYLRTEVRINRPNVDLDAPRYVTPTSKTAPSYVEAADLLRGEVARADLPLRVAAFASRNTGAQPIKLVVVVEPGDPKAALISAIVAVMDASGQVAGQWTARRAELARSPLLTAVPVAAGTYRVRVAASDENGRGGIAEYEARAQLQGSGRGTWSTIVLGVAAPAGFAPRLLFADEPSAVAYVEVYGAASAADVKATFEIAANADGPALVSASAEATRGEGFVMLTAPLSLAAVPPGDSVVRARITIDGAPAGTALATLRKSGR